MVFLQVTKTQLHSFIDIMGKVLQTVMLIASCWLEISGDGYKSNKH